MTRQGAVLFKVEPGLAERVADEICDVLADLVPALLDDMGENFLACADEPVDGAQHPVLRMRLVPGAIDHKLRAALRAKGFDLPERNAA